MIKGLVVLSVVKSEKSLNELVSILCLCMQSVNFYGKLKVGLSVCFIFLFSIEQTKYRNYFCCFYI